MQSRTHWKAETKKLLKGVDNMNIAFAGFRHSHILRLYTSVLENKEVNLLGCFEENENAKKLWNRAITLNLTILPTKKF